MISARRDPERAVAELRRAAAHGSRREHHAGLRARHQRHEPRRHRHAGDRPAGAARRPQPLPGLLRLRDVGLPAGEPERDQADRGDPRTGVGRLGRQRAERRGQRDHQVAARDAGDDGSDRLRRVRSRADAARTPASLWYVSGTHAQAVNDRWAYKLSAGGYSQDPLARPTGTDPVRSPDVCPPAHAARIRRSRTRARRSRSSTRRVDYDYAGRRASCRSRAASPAPKASCTPASGRSTSTAASVMGYAKANYTQQGLPRRLLHEHPQRRRRQPADARPAGQADRLQLRHQHLRLRGVERPDVRSRSTSSATAATCASTRSTCRIAPRRRQPHGRRRLRPGRDLPVDDVPLVVGARVDRFDYLDNFVFSPRATFMIKPQRGPDDPRSRTTAPTARRRSSTTSST